MQIKPAQVPNLATALAGPLLELEQQLLRQQAAIEDWFLQQWLATPAPFYCSVDLRNAGFKLAPVDTNLFPAGFNNLNPDLMPLCVEAMQETIKRLCPNISRLLIVPENHTRNLFYLENLASLQEIITKASLEVKIGSAVINETTKIVLPSKRNLILQPLKSQQQTLMVDDFIPEMILLNNDLSDGIPEILKNIKQCIIPTVHLGWFNRLKSDHFQHYANVSKDFAKQFSLDEWLLNPYFRNCGEINFMTGERFDCLIERSEMLLNDIQKKYDEHNVKQQPFVVIKADTGTYGMAVLIICDLDELKNLNRKQRTRMATSKGKQQVSKVIIQEGVPTFETIEAAIAEPVIYMIGCYVVGGFYRVHTKRGPYENLNAPGMHFQSLAFAKSGNNPASYREPTNRFYAYGVVARLAALAAARELLEVRDDS